MLVTVDSRNPMDAKVDLLALPMARIDPEKIPRHVAVIPDGPYTMLRMKA